jgi:hypothetical protein
MKRIQLMVTLGLVILAAPQVKAAATYDAVDDFSISSNPNGQWSYLYDTGSGPQLLTHPQSNIGAGLDDWWDGFGIPDSVRTIGNPTGTTVHSSTIVPPTNLLGLDPEIEKSDIVRWTAPSAGTWLISGLFQGIDIYEHRHTVQVLENSTKTLLAPTTISAYGQTVNFSADVYLAKGATIDFIVNGATVYTNLYTGLSATIVSSVPEPSSLVPGLIASVTCGSLYWRRR